MNASPNNLPRVAPRRIVVLKAGALGDFILTLPALAALRARYPGAELVLIGPQPYSTLALHPAYADALISFEDRGLGPLFVAASEPTVWLQQVFGGCQLAVLWSYDRQGYLCRNLAALGVPHVLRADPFPGENVRCHVADHLVQSLAPLGVRPGPLLGVPLSLHGSDRQAAAQSLRRWGVATPDESAPTLIAIHPGAGNQAKRWPVARFAALARELELALDAHLLVLSGPADKAAAAEVMAGLAGRRAVLVEDLPLRTVAAVLARCRLYVGNDSGISHLAGIVGAPTVAFFGPTDPRRWHPIGSRVVTWRSEGGDLDALPTGRALEICLASFHGVRPGPFAVDDVGAGASGPGHPERAGAARNNRAPMPDRA